LLAHAPTRENASAYVREAMTAAVHLATLLCYYGVYSACKNIGKGFALFGILC
jgi:hypothetical protein